MLEKELEKLGLSKNEAKVYLAGLELGYANGSQIAKKTDLKRTTTYGIIKSLQEKGLFSIAKKKGINLFVAEDPAEIEAIAERRLKLAQNILPQLLSFANINSKKPKINYFEGKTAFVQIFNDVLKHPKQEIVAWASNLAFCDYDANYWDDYFMVKRKENKIWQRMIISKSKISSQFKSQDDKNLRETRIDENENNKVEVIMALYGKRKTAIFSTDEMMGLIIESETIHNTLKTFFEIHWKTLKK
jgi:sugar-specific transcriptional regulator TrmB